MTDPQTDAIGHYSDMSSNVQEGGKITLEPEEPGQADRRRICSLEIELAETRDRWLRAEAENANVRSRAKRDVDETKQFAIQRFATDVVEAADNLHRGLDSIRPAEGAGSRVMNQIRDGFTEVERSFVAMLGRNGIKRSDPTGTAFDAANHQAMGQQESPVHAPGTVLRTLSPAWTLNGRILRPAMVVVARQP